MNTIVCHLEYDLPNVCLEVVSLPPSIDNVEPPRISQVCYLVDDSQIGMWKSSYYPELAMRICRIFQCLDKRIRPIILSEHYG